MKLTIIHTSTVGEVTDTLTVTVEDVAPDEIRYGAVLEAVKPLLKITYGHVTTETTTTTEETITEERKRP